MEEVKSELVSIRKEDYDLLVAGCERLLEKENEKPVAMDPDMFSGLNAMLRKEEPSQEFELNEGEDQEVVSDYDVSDLTLENNIS